MCVCVDGDGSFCGCCTQQPLLLPTDIRYIHRFACCETSSYYYYIMKLALLGALVTQRIANNKSFYCNSYIMSRSMSSSSTSSLKAASTSTSTTSSTKPFAVIVQAEVQMERMDEFLTMIAYNAAETRKEPGCLRFGTFSLCLCVGFSLSSPSFIH